MRRDLDPIDLPPPHLDPGSGPSSEEEIRDLENVGEQPIDDLDPGVADDEAARQPARPVRQRGGDGERGPIDDPRQPSDTEGHPEA